jgi:hypothetical protein
VLKSCKWAKESLFKQALSFANVMADEACIAVFELLSFPSLQVQFSKTPGSKYRSVKVKFHKVWDLTSRRNTAIGSAVKFKVARQTKKMHITEGRILQTELYGFIPFAFCSTSITLSTVDLHPIFILLYSF